MRNMPVLTTIQPYLIISYHQFLIYNSIESLIILLLVITVSLPLFILCLPWVNPQLPRLQMKILSYMFRLFWLFNSQEKYKQPTFIPSEKYILPTTPEEFNHTEKTILQCPVRPMGMQYFFADFVFPFLPLDLTGSHVPSWERIMQAFKEIISERQIEAKCRLITKEQVYNSLNIQTLSISDHLFRKLVVDIMWVSVVCPDNPGTQEEIIIKESIYRIVQDISYCFTENINPDCQQRILWSKEFYHSFKHFLENTKNGAFLLQLEQQHSLSIQEWLTLIVMEFFVTPALEIGETVTNLIKEYEDKPEILHHAINDEKYMNAAIYSIVCKYPVIQSMFRMVEGTKTSYHVAVDVAAEQNSLKFQPENFLTNECSSYKWMAFGSGSRICKGRVLAVNITSEIIRAIYNKYGKWPQVEVSSGRRVHPHVELDERFFRLHSRAWSGQVLYSLDQIIRPNCPATRFYLPNSLFS
jgi:hypothetical protein